MGRAGQTDLFDCSPWLHSSPKRAKPPGCDVRYLHGKSTLSFFTPLANNKRLPCPQSANTRPRIFL